MKKSKLQSEKSAILINQSIPNSILSLYIKDSLLFFYHSIIRISKKNVGKKQKCSLTPIRKIRLKTSHLVSFRLQRRFAGKKFLDPQSKRLKTSQNVSISCFQFHSCGIMNRRTQNE